MKSYEHDGVDLEDGKTRKAGGDKPTLRKIPNQALLSGLAYCVSSCSMILVNKFVLSSYNFNAGIFLMLYQNFVSVIIVMALTVMGLITTEPLTLRLIKVWFPVNVIFVGMLITSMFSLKYINVAMVTVLKNVTNVITAVGEMYLFNKHHDNKVWLALFLMIISAVSGGITDLSFNAVGYAWQIANCFLTASYSLTLRKTMDTAKQVTQSGNLNEFSMVLLNNTLSLPLGLILSFAFNEIDYLYNTPLLRLPGFWMVMTLSGLLGLAISFTSMWFLHQTGATTYRFFPSLMQIISAVSGGITDLSFNAVGYAWQIANCFLTASYSLTLRKTMDTAKQVTQSGNLNEFSMVLLNNTLSLPLGLILSFAFNEIDYLYNTPLLRLPGFWMVMTLSGLLGLAISFTSMWFLHQTGATTYSLVGSLNKIPLSIAGIVLFHVPTSLQNSASILFGLVAGVVFARAKMREKS
ncbi:hypothetical protein F2Q68_00019888 [Brassica cretica]|uniref:Sugar phosphate transporter domain-containing protein n=1 Tax=Brassica cretica TaxID=69181 RepID=A0A8S9FNY8_BRACR|nr:hypothetical protein F2Q68_00019888 [Brassica cretica]